MSTTLDPNRIDRSLLARRLGEALAFIALALLVALPPAVAATAKSGGAYRLGPTDLVRIQVFGEPELSIETRVRDNGTISFPLLGQLKIAGLTLGQVEQLVTRRLKGPYLVDPKVTASIGAYRQFYVNGEVAKPGGYAFQPGLSVRNAISIAGGFKTGSGAADDKVLMLRQGHVDAKPQPVSLDAAVQPGDTIIVEPQYVFINGEVNKPGSLPFQAGLTVRMAISLAGGFTERASKSSVSVVHDRSHGKAPENLGLDDPVRPGDIITVERSFF